MPLAEEESPTLMFLEQKQQEKMEKYYKYQSYIYDKSRWLFLFGRERLINLIPSYPSPKTILEIGCGTGYNLVNIIRRFPEANVYGIDSSSSMLKAAAKKVGGNSKVTLLHETYGSHSDSRPDKADLIIFSYSLSMINPHWGELIVQAQKDLNEGGIIAVIDFQKSNYNWHHRMMKNNHVRLDDHLLPLLRTKFEIKTEISKPAYGGIWRYFMFVGVKKQSYNKTELT